MTLPAHPKETREQALALLAQPGATLRGVSRETGISADTLARWARQAGIPMENNKGGRPPKEKP